MQDLMQHNQFTRLGSRSDGAQEVRGHEWFSGFDFDALLSRKIAPPHVPKVADEHDMSNFDISETGLLTEEWLEEIIQSPPWQDEEQQLRETWQQQAARIQNKVLKKTMDAGRLTGKRWMEMAEDLVLDANLNINVFEDHWLRWTRQCSAAVREDNVEHLGDLLRPFVVCPVDHLADEGLIC